MFRALETKEKTPNKGFYHRWKHHNHSSSTQVGAGECVSKGYSAPFEKKGASSLGQAVRQQRQQRQATQSNLDLENRPLVSLRLLHSFLQLDLLREVQVSMHAGEDVLLLISIEVWSLLISFLEQ
ncbi:hypothetical protein GOP47_0015514 [Adiantum capillus-veneris]|uniref:Uncharacterized protein n=1 Tax=Adiantum capillus-veneris TaxID=13818 RepID=A0A9D4UKZ3_ADICA|nr:hypothetical protein GOP47_0015514 [Adiantum capillus-veneris]